MDKEKDKNKHEPSSGWRHGGQIGFFLMVTLIRRRLLWIGWSWVARCNHR